MCDFQEKREKKTHCLPNNIWFVVVKSESDGTNPETLRQHCSVSVHHFSSLMSVAGMLFTLSLQILQSPVLKSL